MTLSVFPDVPGGLKASQGIWEAKTDGLFTRYTLKVPKREIGLRVERVKPNKAVVQVSPGSFAGVDDVLLRIDYRGDVGNAIIGGRLISDNFSNGTTWEIGLKRFLPEVAERPIHLYITPLRKGRMVITDSAVGPHRTFVGEEVAEIDLIRAVPVYSVIVSPNT